ncbi:ASCH domain-containing protein [Bradyrhizobium sediminis]|uniref:ASCH domain-containing protein n=1 Tax=Bradyrhizobium sediminis TaxID=2840469 RepID=UPI003510B5E7
MSLSAVPEKYRALRSFAFGDSPRLADELLELVIKGVRTATCSTEDEPNTSTPGERWIVLDGQGTPRCVIESTEVTYRRFGEVDAAFAHDEGEGDRSLAYWRQAHRNYFGRQGKFSEDMMLMCERFRLVEIYDEVSPSSARQALSVPSPLVGEGQGGG